MVSIPFDQGDVFRPNLAEAIKEADEVSIPFDQGDVFRLYYVRIRSSC